LSSQFTMPLLYAFIKRRFRVVLTQKSFFIFQLAQPLIWLLTYGLSINNALSKAFEEILGTNFLAFEALGLPMLFSISFPLANSLNMSLEFSLGSPRIIRLLSSHDWRASFILADVAVYAILSLLALFELLVISFPFGFPYSFSLIGFLSVVLVIFLSVLFTYSLAIVLSKVLLSVSSYVSLLLLPFFLFSGIYYPVMYLPRLELLISAVIPYSHAIAIIRYFLLGYKASQLGAIWSGLFNPITQIALSLTYLILFSFILLVLASRLLDKLGTREVLF
jgi:hypothetical protein